MIVVDLAIQFIQYARVETQLESWLGRPAGAVRRSGPRVRAAASQAALQAAAGVPEAGELVRAMPPCLRAVLVALLVAAPWTSCWGKLVTFDNSKPRLDSLGSILKGHDGTTQRFDSGGGKLFYYHAMGYPPCNETGRINGCNYNSTYGKGAKTCIYGRNNSLLVYSSPDLSSGSWKLEETVYPNAAAGFPPCTYFRSQAVYNPKTKKYVLWANTAGCDEKACGAKPCGAYAMGTSDHPAGPFQFIGTDQPTAASMQHKGGIGDYALFVSVLSASAQLCWVVSDSLPRRRTPPSVSVLTHSPPVHVRAPRWILMARGTSS
jgi:hypothetical protein|eukprot:COSAG06_NODE_2559_length_6665_cov_3.854554_2_plen_320_part_00